MKKLIIAEKPSVARNIGDALDIKVRKNGYMEGDDYIITWVFGHLLQLFDVKDYDETRKSWRMENFPFIPEEFQYKIKSENNNKNIIDQGAQKQIKIIEQLMNREDVEGVISATDYDREGQIIADEIFSYLKTEQKIERLLLNEWTKDEVLAGLNKLCLNSKMQSMQDAGFGRQMADWLIGINLTSVATVKYNNANHDKMLNIGRVLLPTLKIIYDRDKEIQAFEKSTYYKLNATLKTKEDGIIKATYQEKDREKFEDQEELKTISSKLERKTGRIIEKEVERKKENPPYLFNLSNLQGHITSKYKDWTSDKVLKVAQDLYEKKIITYPRTASSVLDESLKEKTAKVLGVVKKGLPYEEEIKFVATKRIFDSSKVESHSAIIPTYIRPKDLSPDQETVYQAVKNRFIAQFLPISESEETKLTIKAEECDVAGILMAKGKVQLVEGWKKAESIVTKEVMMPPVEKGEALEITKVELKEVVRKPPKYHTEKTLLRVMETCGKSATEEDSEEMMMAILSGFSIGTPATRAETIKKLKDIGYIMANKKSLTCTDLGVMMVETFPVKDLFDLDYTGRLEKTLTDIEKEKFSKDDFMKMIKEFTIKSVNQIKNDKEFAGKVSVPDDAKVVGICPECGNLIVETEKAFGCSNWKNGCKFTIWKNDKFIEGLGKKVSIDMVELLLKNGKVGFRGLTSKKGNKFNAYLRYQKDPEKGYYNWKFEFID